MHYSLFAHSFIHSFNLFMHFIIHHLFICVVVLSICQLVYPSIHPVIYVFICLLPHLDSNHFITVIHLLVLHDSFFLIFNINLLFFRLQEVNLIILSTTLGDGTKTFFGCGRDYRRTIKHILYL